MFRFSPLFPVQSNFRVYYIFLSQRNLEYVQILSFIYSPVQFQGILYIFISKKPGICLDFLLYFCAVQFQGILYIFISKKPGICLDFLLYFQSSPISGYIIYFYLKKTWNMFRFSPLFLCSPISGYIIYFYLKVTWTMFRFSPLFPVERPSFTQQILAFFLKAFVLYLDKLIQKKKKLVYVSQLQSKFCTYIIIILLNKIAFRQEKGP